MAKRTDILREVYDWLSKTKNGTLIELDNIVEMRHKTGYLIKVERLNGTYKVTKGYVTHTKNRIDVQRLYTFEFNYHGLNKSATLDNIKSYINESGN